MRGRKGQDRAGPQGPRAPQGQGFPLLPLPGRHRPQLPGRLGGGREGARGAARGPRRPLAAPFGVSVPGQTPTAPSACALLGTRRRRVSCLAASKGHTCDLWNWQPEGRRSTGCQFIGQSPVHSVSAIRDSLPAPGYEVPAAASSPWVPAPAPDNSSPTGKTGIPHGVAVTGGGSQPEAWGLAAEGSGVPAARSAGAPGSGGPRSTSSFGGSLSCRAHPWRPCGAQAPSWAKSKFNPKSAS